MLTCYLDESGTDSNSPVAVVAGLLLKQHEADWLEEEWVACLSEFDVPWPLHMKEFGEHGTLGSMTSEERRALFKKIAKIINKRKSFSVASILHSSEYKDAFGGLTNFSMYGAAFLTLALANCGSANAANYREATPYLLDNGNRFAPQVVEAHAFLTAGKYAHLVGSIGFDSDDRVSALQAADVVSWSVRRKNSIGLNSGFEPLTAILEIDHNDVFYEEVRMLEIADDIRTKISTLNEANP